MTIKQIGANACFGGIQKRFQHSSQVLQCEMVFSVYLPPQAKHGKVPVLYWLSGLTCSDENFVNKAGAQRYAAEHGVAIVAPDTSPRGEGVPDDPDGAYDFGLGAGFYVSASQQPWNQHYHMYEYVTDELPTLIQSELPLDTQRSAISGHSMGGHGALTIALKNPARYRSMSAFAPICSPLHCPWGEKALGNYLGNDRETWKLYDTTELLASASERVPCLVDQGTGDEFLESQLKTPLLVAAAERANYPISVRMQPDYDHSYFFIASFIGEHIAFHAQHLA